MSQIVKRKGHTENFDERKLYASVYAACTTLRITDEEAETIAQMVADEVKKEIKDTKEVTSKKLQDMAEDILMKYHPDAAYLYASHKDVS